MTAVCKADAREKNFFSYKVDLVSQTRTKDPFDKKRLESYLVQLPLLLRAELETDTKKRPRIL